MEGRFWNRIGVQGKSHNSAEWLWLAGFEDKLEGGDLLEVVLKVIFFAKLEGVASLGGMRAELLRQTFHNTRLCHQHLFNTLLDWVKKVFGGYFVL